MLRKCLQLVLAVIAAGPGIAHGAAAPPLKRVVVIPVRDEISEPALYILRRGLKEAVAEKDDAVVLDLKTPGGALDVTLEMMEALGKFPGQTFAYVDGEAMSAGAILSSVTSEIWFAPGGVIGAAAPVSSTGQDVDATMKEKIVSYMKARVRAIAEEKGYRYRGDVLSAMIDSDFELTVEGQVLKPKGQLLSLTATEAMKRYGKPPQPLLGAGIVDDVDDLLAKKYGAHGYEARRLEITWSEQLAVWLNRASPVLLGLGLLALFVEFKTGGFGLFGAAGVGLLALVFFSTFVAGLSGHEPIVLFGVGVVLVALELAFFHSAGFLGVVGIIFMLASLVWSMSDLWPNEPVSVAWSADAFSGPFANLSIGVAIAIAGGVIALRFLPKGWIWDRLTIGATVPGSAQSGGAAPEAAAGLDAVVGREGIAATALRPSGQIEVDGRRYEATVEVGTIDPGTAILVCGRRDFGFVVRKS